MIKRFLSFRGWIGLVFIVAFLVVVWNRGSSSYESRFVPYFITNAYLNSLVQTVGFSNSIDTNIVVVNGPPYNANDSLVGMLVQHLSSARPSVIAVDYNLSNERLFESIDIDPNVQIVLATAIDNDDSLYKPLNIFKGSVSYGHTMGMPDNQEWVPRADSFPSLSQVCAKLYDQARYYQFTKRRNAREYIRYVPPAAVIVLDHEDVFSDTFEKSWLTGKIVLVGKLGDTKIHREPGFLDNVDVHDTPLGDQFGVMILYSEIHTFLGNFIDRSPVWADYAMVFLLCTFSAFLLLGISHWPKAVLYLVAKTWVVVMVFGVQILGMYAFAGPGIMIDYESCCWALIASSETAFWITLTSRNSNVSTEIRKI